MLTSMLLLGLLLNGVAERESPLQLCVADEVKIERRFDMTARGHARCHTGIVLLTGKEAIVRASADEKIITIEVRGGARLQKYGEVITGDRMTAVFANSLGTPLWLESVQVAFERTHVKLLVPQR